MMAVGTKIVWSRHDNEDVTKMVIVRGTITKVGRDTYYVDNHHKAEDQIYAAFCLPETDESVALLQDMVDEQARHKAYEQTNLKRFFELRNKYVREGKL